jgi:HAMP domain-containing protein
VNGLLKSAIWIRTLVFAVIPFMIVYIIISVFVGQSILQDKVRQTKIDVETLARFNEVNLTGGIENVKLAIKIASIQLGNINPRNTDARKIAENILVTSFEIRQIYNAWFAFEPDAFDGRDAEYAFDYPGSPSGRFMRSFVRDENGGFLTAPDMDEAVIDDPDESSWYTVPKESGQQYIDINSDDLFYDYGLGGGEVIAISLVYPVFRNNAVIGCVGADFLLDDMVLGSEIIPGAQSVLFRDNGAVIYSGGSDFLGKRIEELEFPHSGKIRKAFVQKEPLFLPDEYSGFLGDKAYVCFMPVRLIEFEEIVYIYAAIPKSMIMKTVYAVFWPIGAALAAALIIFTFLLFYLAKSISGPIRELTAASEAIVRGDIDRKFAMFHSGGEIGAMTRSLYHMVEQFQMYITLQERSKDLLNIYTRLYEALYQQDNIEDVFDAAVFIIADYFEIKAASLVVLKNDAARYVAHYSAARGLWKAADENGAVVFEHHNRAADLLAGRKYIFLNASGISEQGIQFASEDSASLCILPVRTGGILQGYFLMEGNETAGAFVHYDDALIFISDTISYILTQKKNVPVPVERPQAGLVQVQPEEERRPVQSELKEVEPAAELPVIQAARRVEGLDVDRGIFLVGGEEDHYGELLRISAKVFTEGMPKMRSQYVSDLPGFAIGIHGMKSALYNIGANELGDAAKKLEFAAKAGEAAFCQQAYPVFEDQLAALTRDLVAVTRTEAGAGGAGSIPELEAALEKTLEACRNFDAIQAGKTIASFTGFTWEPENIGTDVKAAAEALENIDYDEAEALINALLKKIRNPENGGRRSGGGIGA